MAKIIIVAFEILMLISLCKVKPEGIWEELLCGSICILIIMIIAEVLENDK